MDKVLLVGVGGGVGAVLRYGVGALVGRMKAGWSFPLETLVINAAGCVAIGFLAASFEARGTLSPSTRALLFTGFLGGFTTYSAFGHETFQLVRDGRWLAGGASTALQLLLGVGGVWAGDAWARLAAGAR